MICGWKKTANILTRFIVPTDFLTMPPEYLITMGKVP